MLSIIVWKMPTPELIGGLVRHSGIVVLVGLMVSALGIWGIARLPTAFIPIEDQGYGMIAVQLPDGAALGRTVNSLNETTKIALATPGVKQVISIAGVSVLDNYASLASPGINFIIFDDWSKRDKAKGQDLKSLLFRVAEQDRNLFRTEGLSCWCRRQSKELEMLAVFRCRCSSSAAASIIPSSMS